MTITFLLNGERVELEDVRPTATLLDWLRDARGLTGTKEGCNEGDCGACTVMVSDADGARALNSCILFLPQLNGKAVRTVEGAAGPDGELHPAQSALVLPAWIRMPSRPGTSHSRSVSRRSRLLFSHFTR